MSGTIFNRMAKALVTAALGASVVMGWPFCRRVLITSLSCRPTMAHTSQERWLPDFTFPISSLLAGGTNRRVF